MTEARLAHEAWQVIKDEDWVLTANTLKEWVHKVWDFDKPYRHLGRELGTGTQIGMSIGVALAYKGTGKLVVDIQPDGDLMFDLGALWMPIKYNIPMLILMYNNRAYYNDWAHQIHMAHQRGTDPQRAYIGMDLEGAAARLRPYRQRHRLVRRRRHRRSCRSRPGVEARHRPSQSRQTGAGRRRRLAPRRECLEHEICTTKEHKAHRSSESINLPQRAQTSVTG